MDIDRVELPAMRIAGIEHRGPYERTSESFVRLFPIAEQLGLPPAFVAVYYGDQVHALAGCHISDDAEIGPLQELRTEPGQPRELHLRRRTHRALSPVVCGGRRSDSMTTLPWE